MSESVAISVTEPSSVGEVRRLAAALAQRLAWNEVDIGKVSLVATETANNLVKHARHGQIFLRPVEETGANGVELLVLDKGPGMSDVSQALRDGYSTAGSPGNGLGAIARLSNLFDINSVPGRGTAMLSRLWAGAAQPSTISMEIGVVCVAKPGEEVCGDAWSVRHLPGRTVIVVADGLGHGQYAAQAAAECLRVFNEKPTRRPAEIIQAAHGPLRSTRGASMAVAEIHFDEGVVYYAGIGNIAGSILSGDSSRSLVSHNGIVGHEMRRLQEFSYGWPADAIIVLHSDGLQSRWTLENYPGLTVRHPALVAGTLYRDFHRASDDVTVLVARQGS
jgi:anti-sigma regulatory factor (Ser/Thr protein kinase)